MRRWVEFNPSVSGADKSRKPCLFVLDRGYTHVGFHGSKRAWRHIGDMIRAAASTILGVHILVS